MLPYFEYLIGNDLRKKYKIVSVNAIATKLNLPTYNNSG
jgi:hypothetical protein